MPKPLKLNKCSSYPHQRRRHGEAVTPPAINTQISFLCRMMICSSSCLIPSICSHCPTRRRPIMHPLLILSLAKKINDFLFRWLERKPPEARVPNGFCSGGRNIPGPWIRNLILLVSFAPRPILGQYRDALENHFVSEQFGSAGGLANAIIQTSQSIYWELKRRREHV